MTTMVLGFIPRYIGPDGSPDYPRLTLSGTTQGRIKLCPDFISKLLVPHSITYPGFTYDW